MAKPSITTRAGKGTALDYTELDANFTNLQNATVSLTAGTGGTQVTADLNGNITLVAGTGVTLTGDNTAKTITINSAAGSSSAVDASGNLSTQLNLNGNSITNTLGNISLLDTVSISQSLTVSSGLTVNGNSILGNASSDATTVNGTLQVIGNILMSGYEIYGLSGAPNNGARVFVGSGSLSGAQLLLSASTSGSVEIVGNIKVNDPGGAPTNTTTIVDWLKITMGSTVYYLPLYQ